MGFFRKFALCFCALIVVEALLFGLTLEFIGIPTTIGMAIGTGFLGAWLTKKQGLKALMNYQKSISMGQMPHREVVDGILILVASAVLVTPGFLTDFIGFSLLVPKVRGKLREILAEKLKGSFNIVTPGGKKSGQTESPNRTSSSSSSGGGADDVINVESELIDE